MDNTVNWLKQISEVYGVSGFESRVKKMLQEKTELWLKLKQEELYGEYFGAD